MRGERGVAIMRGYYEGAYLWMTAMRMWDGKGREVKSKGGGLPSHVSSPLILFSSLLMLFSSPIPARPFILLTLFYSTLSSHSPDNLRLKGRELRGEEWGTLDRI